MPRQVLQESAIHEAIRGRIADLNADLVAEVKTAIGQHAVVVVGMRGNPFVRKARRLLDAAGLAHHDLDVGGYTSQWRRRNALKMWSGWATFPMVFVKGQLVGGANDLARLQEQGELAKLLA